MTADFSFISFIFHFTHDTDEDTKAERYPDMEEQEGHVWLSPGFHISWVTGGTLWVSGDVWQVGWLPLASVPDPPAEPGVCSGCHPASGPSA